MSKPFAVFDIDGTIFRSSLLIELINQLVADDVFPEAIYQEFEKEHQAWLNRTGGYQGYISAVIAAFDKHLNGKDAAAVKQAAQKTVESTLMHTYRFTRGLLDDLADSHFLIAISGSPIAAVDIFAKKYGFGAYVGTKHTEKNGKFGPVESLGYIDKARTLKSLVKNHDLDFKDSIGVGDTESDSAFLELVEKPVAFNPNQKLLTQAKEKNWDVFVERKDVVYHLNCQDKDGCRLYQADR